MRSNHRRLVRRATAGPRTVGALLVMLLAGAALLTACSAQATTGGVSSAGGDAAAGAKAAAGADWSHVLQVVANLKADPPGKPVVILLGGSAARESTIGDNSWRAQIEAGKGPATAAYNLGSSNRTLAQNVAIVQALPKVPAILYIGINVGVFTSAQKTATISLPKPITPLPPYRQHRYSQSRILSAARKKTLLDEWLVKRYPVFKKNYASNLKTLDKLLVACKQRGLHPVLFELPLNTAIIGHALDAPVARYTSGCRALARKHGVPWVSFVSTAPLPNADFYDLWHLVEPGRIVWQKLLSAKTAEFLEKYGL